MTNRRTLLLAAALCAAALPAAAQSNWPTRPIRIIVPYGPGSSPDVLVRLFSDKLGKSLGQPVVVENKPGAGGNTGTDYVAKAAPDGYTWLVSTNGPLVYSTVFNPKLPYDPFKDLAPVMLAAVQPNVCAVSNDLKVDDVKGWVAAMKKDPGKYNYSSTGVGSMSHLSVEIVKLKSDSYAVHLPYASSPLAVLAIMQGDVQFACVPPVAVMVLYDLGYVVRMVRASMVEVMTRPYIRTAILKGMRFRTVIMKHALRNAMIAPFTVILLQLNYLVTGVVVVEAVFAYPGFGRMLLEAALAQDVAVVEAGALFAVMISVFTQIAGDLGYMMLNPRIRFS